MKLFRGLTCVPVAELDAISQGAGRNRYWTAVPRIAITYATTNLKNRRVPPRSVDIVIVGELEKGTLDGDTWTLDLANGGCVAMLNLVFVERFLPVDERIRQLAAGLQELGINTPGIPPVVLQPY